jgi:hypothetical protein
MISPQTYSRGQDAEINTQKLWPFKKNAKTLSKKLLELSKTQRQIIMILSPTFSNNSDGLYQNEIASEVKKAEGEVHYRLRDLENHNLFEALIYTDGVVYKLPKDVKKLLHKNTIVQNALKDPNNFSNQ